MTTEWKAGISPVPMGLIVLLPLVLASACSNPAPDTGGGPTDDRSAAEAGHFSCRVDGDAWYHEADFPTLEVGRQTGTVRLAEVWRRIE